MRKITLILILTIATISCQDRELNEESQLKFDKSVENIKKSLFNINIDSFKVVYEKLKAENPQTGLDFANRFEVYSNKLLQKREEIKIETGNSEARIQIRKAEEEAERKRNWKNSKYGKLQKKHPSWSNDECINVINKKIWIGMSLEMLKYMRGQPDSANPSNYGSGTQWQWCWDDYTPSCFYGEDDGIITSYN